MASTEAAKAASRKWYAENRERARANGRAWYERNKEKHHENSRAWKAAHPESVKQYAQKGWKKWNKPELQAAWKEQNRDRLREGERKRYHADPDARVKNAAKTGRRRTAMPVWADKHKVLAFYVRAKELTLLTGVVHHVDHVVPIKHRLVCGLHNEFNLQVLPAKQNLQKKNRFSAEAAHG